MTSVSQSKLTAYGLKVKTVEGLCTDCRILLSRFEQHNTLRFANFCEVWKQMNFSIIHYGRPDSKGCKQLVEYLFRIFCGYVGTSCPLQYRVGALYGLYSVYHTQLCKPKAKIRVTTTIWKDIQELHQQIKDQQHYDVDYIIRSLKDARTFHFVAMPIQLECGSKEAIPDDEKDLGGVKTQGGILLDLDAVYEMVKKVSNVDEEYRKLKSSLQSCSQISSLQNQRSLNAISEDFIPLLESEVQDYDEWKSSFHTENTLQSNLAAPVCLSTLGLVRPSTSSHKAGDEEDFSAELSISKRNATEHRAQLIHRIKTNAFTSVSQVGRSNRHRQPVVADNEMPSVRRRRSRHGLIKPLKEKAPRLTRKKCRHLKLN